VVVLLTRLLKESRAQPRRDGLRIWRYQSIQEKRMKKLDVVQMVSVLANIGAIAGIVFLATEMRLNTRAIQAQTRDSITEKQMQLYAWQATSSELAAVVAKAVDEGQESLDRVEDQMLFGYLEAFFREHENALYQFEQGLFSARDFSGRAQNMRVFVAVPAFRAFWERRRDHYSQSLRAKVDRILIELENRGAD
jgi:hypothetical protein